MTNIRISQTLSIKRYLSQGTTPIIAIVAMMLAGYGGLSNSTPLLNLAFSIIDEHALVIPHVGIIGSDAYRFSTDISHCKKLMR